MQKMQKSQGSDTRYKYLETLGGANSIHPSSSAIGKLDVGTIVPGPARDECRRCRVGVFHRTARDRIHAAQEFTEFRTVCHLACRGRRWHRKGGRRG